MRPPSTASSSSPSSAASHSAASARAGPSRSSRYEARARSLYLMHDLLRLARFVLLEAAVLHEAGASRELFGLLRGPSLSSPSLVLRPPSCRDPSTSIRRPQAASPRPFLIPSGSRPTALPSPLSMAAVEPNSASSSRYSDFGLGSGAPPQSPMDDRRQSSAASMYGGAPPLMDQSCVCALSLLTIST